MSCTSEVVSLKMSAFKCTLYNKVKNAAHHVTSLDLKYLWKVLLDKELTDYHLQLLFTETKRLDRLLSFVFTTDRAITMTQCTHANASTQLHAFFYKDLTNLTRMETLRFAMIYTFLLSLNETFLPERFAIWWLGDKEGLCKWCTDECVYVRSEETMYLTPCCGKFKLTYHDFDKPQLLTKIVTSMNSYCCKCQRPMFSVHDLEKYKFPKDMYLCTICV
jgi:hypothetical protein